MTPRFELKVIVSKELFDMDLESLVERAKLYDGGAEYAEQITTQVNRTSCNGCTLNSNMAALRVWIAKKEKES